MKELENTNNIDYKVNTVTGEAFISFSEAGKLNGVSKSVMHRWCGTMNWDTKQGLTPKMLQKANAHFAIKMNKPEAIRTMAMLAEGGAKAFIYHKAGVELVALAKPTQPQLSDQVQLAQIQLEMAKLKSGDLAITEHTKQLEIAAKVKLGKKKTGIRRLSDCPSGFVTMKTLVRELEDFDTPIAVSALTEFVTHYAVVIDKRANCIHKEQFYNMLKDIVDFCEVDGAFWLDKTSGIKFKAEWLDK